MEATIRSGLFLFALFSLGCRPGVNDSAVRPLLAAGGQPLALGDSVAMVPDSSRTIPPGAQWDLPFGAQVLYFHSAHLPLNANLVVLVDRSLTALAYSVVFPDTVRVESVVGYYRRQLGPSGSFNYSDNTIVAEWALDAGSLKVHRADGELPVIARVSEPHGAGGVAPKWPLDRCLELSVVLCSKPGL